MGLALVHGMGCSRFRCARSLAVSIQGVLQAANSLKQAKTLKAEYSPVLGSVGDEESGFTIVLSNGCELDVTVRQRWPNGKPLPTPKLPPGPVGRPPGEYKRSRAQVAIERNARILAAHGVALNRATKGRDKIRQRFTQAD